MKFHVTYDNKTAACGAVTNRPDTFLYNSQAFISHYAKESRCKRCEAIITNSWVNPIKTTIKRITIGIAIVLMAIVHAATATDLCKATKKDGTPCKGRPGTSGYCYFHDPANRCTQIKKDGTQCKGIKMKGTDKCYVHRGGGKK